MPVSESFPVRGSMLGAGFLTAALLLMAMLPDQGEVVRLITQDEAGQFRETQLWIAELDGQAYLRASDPAARWLTRLRSNARASLERNGRAVEIVISVEDDPQIEARLGRAMAEKYGLADRIWRVLRSSDSVVIRIQPVDSGEAIGAVGSPGTSPAPLDPE